MPPPRSFGGMDGEPQRQQSPRASPGRPAAVRSESERRPRPPSAGSAATAIRAERRAQMDFDEGGRPPRGSVGAGGASLLPESPRSLKASGGGGDDKDELPPGAKGADFKTLQAMIARGIQDAEAGASQLECNITDDEAGIKRHREELRRRREEEAVSRQKEREAARQKRRQEDEERRKRQTLQLEREEAEEQRQRQLRQGLEQQCRLELKAASRIQARWRGRLSRNGKPVRSPLISPRLHSEPWAKRAPVSRAASQTPPPDLD